MGANESGQKNKAALRRNSITIALFALAGVLLVFGTVGSSRAALTYFSENYSAQITVSDIGVTLVENGADVSWRNYTHRDDLWDTQDEQDRDPDDFPGTLLGNMLAESDGKLIPGRAYTENLSVRNSGTIDQYVRVMIYRYWLDEDGEKLKKRELSPDLIDLHLTGNGWILDEASSTPERLVLYYTGILSAGEESPDFADTLTVNSAVANKVTETSSTEVIDGKTYTVITNTYDYDGIRFMLEAEVDAVQTHNAVNAIKSAWGVDVAVGADGALSLQ